MKYLNMKILVMFLLLFCFTTTAYANKQTAIATLNIDDVIYTEKTDPLTGQTIKKPLIKLSWIDGSNSHDEDTTPGITNGGEIHSPEKYEIYIRNITKNESRRLLKVVDGDVKKYDVGSNTWLDTGSIYEFQVIPLHYHDKLEKGEVKKVLAEYVNPNFDMHPKKIAITDFDIDVKAIGKEIIVEWEDAGTWADYDIYYEAGECSSYKNMSGKIEDVRMDSKSFIDEVDGRSKLKYVISSNDLKSGKLYSITVRPCVKNIGGVAVAMNAAANIVVANTKIPFKITQESDKYIKLLWWGIESTAGSNGADEFAVKELQILKKDSDAVTEKVVTTLKGENSIKIGYYSDIRPKLKTNYKIKIVYNKMENEIEKLVYMESDWVEYDPGAIRITPAKPKIPKLGNRLDNDDNPIVDLNTYDGTFKINKEDKYINLVWSVFERIDYNQKDKISADKIVDLDVYYDVWLTDDVDVVYTKNNLTIDTDYYVNENSDDEVNYIKNMDGKKIGFKKKYYKYVAAIKNNGVTKGYELKPLEENKIYYLKIVAKKKVLEEVLESEPMVTSIYFDSENAVYTPPVIPKPPMKKRELKSDSISVEWRKSWWEISDTTDVNKNWYNKIWLKDSNIYFEYTVGANEIYLNTSDDVEILKNKLSDDDKSKYEFRLVDLGNEIGYQRKIIPFKKVENDIEEKKKINPSYTLDDYIKNLKSNITIAAGWDEISPIEDSSDENKQTVYIKEENLQSNTSYMFLIISYRKLANEDRLYALNPTTLIVTTNIDEDDVNPNPTVPILYTDTILDTEVRIKWEYNTKMEYQIKMSRKENINDAEDVEIILPENPLDPKYPKDGEKYTMVINDLMPSREYYFWIKSKQKNGEKESEWSNALLIKTKNILPNPIQPPTGFGIAGILDPVGKEYITVEWIRLPDDVEAEEKYKGKKVKKYFSYIVSYADNVKFLDSKEVEILDDINSSTDSSVEVMSKSMIKVKKLEANKRYYFKIKTKLTAVSDDNKEDIVERESNYSEIQIIKTTSVLEYDSGAGDLVEELEEKVTKDYHSGKIDFTINDSQRVLQDIIKKDKFEYIIDLSKYSSRKVEKINIDIPNLFIEGLKEEKVDLKIKTDSSEILIPIKAFNTDMYKKAMKIGGIKKYEIEIEKVDDDKVERYIHPIECYDFEINIVTNHAKLREKYLEDYVIIKYDISDIDEYNKNFKVYYYDEDYDEWTKIKDQYLIKDDYLVLKTGMVGRYIIINYLWK